MSSLLFLSSNDFTVQQGTNGNILCTDISGISLVLFYSTQCVYCQKLIPIFKELPSTINGCQFVMINVSTNKRIVDMARQTILPIKYVPLIVMYVHGKPYYRYEGPKDINEIRRFILEMANNIQNKQQFTGKDSNNKSSIPGYTIGHPLTGDDMVCYLEFDQAYEK